MTKAYGIYLQDEFYNPVCKATIQAAWVVETDHGVIPVAAPWCSEEKALENAENMGFDLSEVKGV